MMHLTDFNTAAGWSPRRIELLRRHHALALTAIQSAELLGVTRNAIVSKRARLALAPRGTRPECTNLPVLPPYGRLGLVGDPQFRTEPLPRMDFAPPEGACPKPLARKEARECAWPLGQAEEQGDHRTQFCCAVVHRRGPYCPDHAQRARRAP